MEISKFYLTVSFAMFLIGALGVLLKKNVIVMFMCIELMLNAANLAFVNFSRNFNSAEGQIYVFFVMAIAAAEAAVGLGIIILIFKNYRSVDVDKPNLLNG